MRTVTWRCSLLCLVICKISAVCVPYNSQESGTPVLKRLEETTLSTAVTSSVDECFDSCAAAPLCVGQRITVLPSNQYKCTLITVTGAYVTNSQAFDHALSSSGQQYSNINKQSSVSGCASNPCQQQGTCVDRGGYFVCQCAAGVTGPLCQSVVDCGPPPSISQAVYTSSVFNTTYQAVVSYQCAAGYATPAGINTGYITCLANATWSTLSCTADAVRSAFYVGSSAALVAAGTSNIAFDTVITNTLYTPYNTTTKQVTSTAQNSVYWFQLSVGIPANTQTNSRLNGLQYPVAVVSLNTAYPADVIVTDSIQSVNTTAQLTVSNLYYAVFGSSTSTSPSYIGTSLLGFRIDNIMSVQVYFAVQCTIINSYSQQIVFDRVLVNVGNAWSSAVNSFKAPYSGNYFFSFATASQSTYSAGLRLLVNSASKAQTFALDSGAGGRNDVSMIRGALMLHLSVNDVVTFQNVYYSYSTADGLTNAQGFFYSPVGGNATAVAWSVTSSSLGSTSGSIIVVPFDVVNVNMQNVWSATIYKATIPLAGKYFIDLTAVLRGSDSGSGSNGNDVMTVCVNAQPINTIKLSTYIANGYITRSRSVLVTLDIGDQVYVTMTSGGFYNFGTYFTGVRLF